MLYSYELNGVEDSFSELISNISPNDTFLVSNTKKEQIKTPSFKWQTDVLNVVPTIKDILEGSELREVTTLSSTKELENYTQIFRKSFVLSDTVAASAVHGRTEEIYQINKTGKEIKNWMETVFLSKQDKVKGDSTTAQKTACLGAQIAASGAADPDTGAVVHKTLTKAPVTADIIDITNELYKAGSNANTIIVNNAHAKIINDAIKEQGLIFGNNGLTLMDGDKQVNTLTDDLGRVWSIVYDRFCPTNLIYFLNTEDLTQCILKTFNNYSLGKWGSSRRYMIEVQAGLRLSNPYAAGLLEWS